MTGNKKFYILTGINALLSCGFAISFPYFAVYLSAKRGVPMSIVGICLSCSMLSTALASLFGGEMSDAWGRKKVMCLSLGGRALLIGLMAFAMQTGAGWLWLAFLHLAGAFAGSFFAPAASAWISDMAPPHERMKFYGLIRIGSNLGWALGPVMGGFIAVKSYSFMFGVTAAVAFMCLCLVWLFIQDIASFHRHFSLNFSNAAGVFADRRLGGFCLNSLLISCVMTQLVIGVSLFCVNYLGYSEKDVGFLYMINGLVVVFFQYHMDKFLEKYRISAGVAVGCLFYAAGYLTVGFSQFYLLTALGILIVSIGEIMTAPGLNAIAANLAPRGRHGRYLGALGLSQQLGSAAGVFIGGNGMQFLTSRSLWLSWLLISLIALAAASGFFRLRKILTEKEDGMRTADAFEEKEALDL